MKRKLKRGLALALAGTMCISATGCGNKKVEKDEGHYFKLTYLDSVPDELKNSYSLGHLVNDKLYYETSSNEEEGTNIETIYCLDILTGENTAIFDTTSLIPENGYTQINSYCADDEGNVYAFIDVSVMDEANIGALDNATEDDVVEYIVNDWGESEEEARQSWKDYWEADYTDEEGNVDYAAFLKDMQANYNSTYKLYKIEASGKVVYEKELNQQDENSSYSYNGMATDKEGNLYVAVNEWVNEGDEDIYYINIYDNSGEVINKIDGLNWVDSLGQLNDGRVACTCYGDNGVELSVLDPKAGKVTETYEIKNVSSFSTYKDDILLGDDGNSLSLLNYKKGKSELLLKYMDYDISSMNSNTYGLLSDGRICIVSNDFGYKDDDTSEVSIALLEECDASEVANVTQIKVACLYADSDFQEKAIKFNKSHEDYHITIKEFYDDSVEDWTEMVNNFTTAVAADDSIDIVCFNEISQARNFAAKGLLYDMYDLIDKDKELSKDDFLENILKASEYDGKLVVLPTSFTVSTVVGKVSDVGTEPGWTVKDMKALLDSKPEGTQLFYGMTRSEALSSCLSLGYKSFVDEEKGTCDFNNREFMDVLEFANMFPEEFEYEDDVDETVLMNQGNVLLSRIQVGDFSEIQMYETIFNDKLTYIGYPTTEGTGAMLSFNNLYGISKNCDSTDIAWEFLRDMYTASDEEEYFYGYSVRKDKYEKAFKDAASDEMNGSTYGWGEFEVEIKPATEEMINDVKNLIANTTAVTGEGGTEMINIINEEAAYYFSGEQSVEDVAAKIQSRMEIYLSETN